MVCPLIARKTLRWVTFPKRVFLPVPTFHTRAVLSLLVVSMSVVVLTGHTGITTAAAFSPNGKVIVTGSQDGTARVWDAWSGATLAVLPGRMGQVRSAAFAPDGKSIVIAGEKGTGERAMARVYRCERKVCGSRSELVALARSQLSKLSRL